MADAASLYTLERLPPKVVEVEGDVRYGASDAVPSRLGEPATGRETVVLVADAREGLIPTAVASLRTHSPDAQVVVVANDPTGPVAAELAALPAGVEVLRLAARLGTAAARNAGVRRAIGAAVVLLDPRVEAAADVAGALARALDDPTVAVAGLRGLATDDLVRFEAAPPDATEVVAVDALAMAFRREDYLARGPLDEHFTLDVYLDAWWSLVLRDVPEDAEFGVTRPRRAVVAPVPFTLRGDVPPDPDERLAKRHRYRFLRDFATRRDLLVEPAQ